MTFPEYLERKCVRYVSWNLERLARSGAGVHETGIDKYRGRLLVDNCWLNWQLLDRYTLGGLLSFRKPGKWFNYACIDRSVPGWDNQTDSTPLYPFGPNSDPVIDPVVGGEVSLVVSF